MFFRTENKYQEVSNEVDQTTGNDVHLPNNCFIDPQCSIPIEVSNCCLWPLLRYYRTPVTGYCCPW